MAAVGESSPADKTEATTHTNPIFSAEIPAQQSYATAVSSRPVLSKFNINMEGNPTAAVPDEVFENSPLLWEDFLVGHIPSPAPHVAKIHVIVNKIWNLDDKNIKIDVFVVNDLTIKFRIRHEAARLRVLRRGMWNICNLPMIVSKWTPIAEDAQPEIKSMPMWILVKKIPNSMFHWKGLSYLASPVGYPKRLHQETELVTLFDEAKIFVEVDLTKALPHTFSFKVQGEEFSVEYAYPWLPPRCDTCQKWGHSENSCLISLGKACSPKSNSSDNYKVKESLPTQNETAAEKVMSESTDKVMTISKEAETVISESRLHDTVEDGENGKVISEQGKIVAVGEAVLCNEEEVIEEGEIQTTQVASQKSPTPPETVPANVNMPLLLTEEGEITPCLGDKIDRLVEKEWTTVKNSGGHHSRNKSGELLVYGEVKIASPSSFDVLRDKDDDGLPQHDSVDENVEDSAAVDSASGTPIDHPAASRIGIENTASRPILPRNSKTGHRFLAPSSQKARNTVQPPINSRNPKNKR